MQRTCTSVRMILGCTRLASLLTNDEWRVLALASSVPHSLPLRSTSSLHDKFTTRHKSHTHFKLSSTVHRCLQHKATPYLVDLCKPVSDIASRQHLRSANSHQLYVQRYRRSMFGRRAFCVAGPTAWNTLPDDFQDPALPPHTFRVGLKTLLFSSY